MGWLVVCSSSSAVLLMALSCSDNDSTAARCGGPASALITSSASARKSAWPLLDGSYSVMGWPKLAASLILVLKLTMVLNIFSAKWLRNSARISLAIFVLMSYILASTLTLTCWLPLSQRILRVSSCLLSPWRAKYPVSTGTMTSVAAINALKVKRLTAGGQSIIAKSNSPFIFSSTLFKLLSRSGIPVICCSKADKSMLDGASSRPSPICHRISVSLIGSFLLLLISTS